MSTPRSHSIHQHVARAVQQLTGTPYAAALQAVRDTNDPKVSQRVARASTELALTSSQTPQPSDGPSTLPCATCGEPVDDLMRATVWLDAEDSRRIREYLNKKRDRREEKIRRGDTTLEVLSAYDLMSIPTAEWQLHHDACIGEDDAAHYFFEGFMLTTPVRALEQLCHLAEKGWPLKETDLVSFFRRVYPPR